MAGPHAAGDTWPPTRRTPTQTALERPRFAPWPSPLAARARGTRPRPPGRLPRPPAPCDGRRRSLATRPRHPGLPSPARSPQFALLPLPAPIKGVGLPLHARTARPRHSRLRRAQAHRGAPYSGHPRPESTPEMEPHHPPEALRCILSLIPSPEHERRRAEPPPSTPLRGAAAADHLRSTQDHRKVAREPLSLSPHFPLAAGHPLAGKRRSRSLLCSEVPPGTLFEKNQNFQGSNCKIYMNLQNSKL